jgi:S1-C subfamily serine protease
MPRDLNKRAQVCAWLLTVVISALAGAALARVSEPGGWPLSFHRSSAFGSSGGLTAADLYERASPAVVQIASHVDGNDAFGNSQKGNVTGSGFAIDHKGHIVTNAHVVSGAVATRVRLSSGKSYRAKIVGIDVSSDIALLAVQAPQKVLEDLSVLAFADSGKVRVGDPVVAIGSPLALSQTATSGIVSAKGREIQAPNGFVIRGALQTDAAINEGNSGGPLLDASGEVIGVNSQIATSGTSTGSIGIGFAIPSSTVHAISSQLLRSGHVARAYLGLTGEEITQAVAQVTSLRVGHGLLVAAVSRGGPAERAGVKPGARQERLEGADYVLGGDVLLSIDGHDLSQTQDLAQTVLAHHPGDRVRLTWTHGGHTRSASVKLADRPSGT